MPFNDHVQLLSSAQSRENRNMVGYFSNNLIAFHYFFFGGGEGGEDTHLDSWLERRTL